MKISIVITTYNRRDSLERCLASLASQNFPSDQYEVVVVADGCTDGTVEFLRSLKMNCAVRWSTSSNMGQPAAQNLGVSVARGELILFWDDDCIASPDVLTTHCEAHTQAEDLIVIGMWLLHSDSPPGTIREIMREIEDRECQRLFSKGASRMDLVLCANSSIHRSAALRFPFDPSYKRIHDIEAGVRLWAAGFRPRFVPKAVAYELYSKNAEGKLRDACNHGRFEVRLVASHPDFKPLAEIVRINQGNWFKRTVRKQLALHANVCGVVLGSIYRSAEVLRRFSIFATLAKRAFMSYVGTVQLRGALEEAGSWEKLEEQFGGTTAVIMYHNVGTPRADEDPGLSTTVAEFEDQIRFLSKMGYKGIRPSDWLLWRDTGHPLPKRRVMLVFDDAYKEACCNAFPILERYGFGAACMVVTGSIGASNQWDEAAGLPSFELMSANEILEWTLRGIEFGGHTRSHPNLCLENQERIEYEVAQCKNDLTRLQGKAPTSFAYPFGCVNDAAEAATRINFELAFTTVPGLFHLGTNPHRVPRISFSPGESKFGMWCRIRFGTTPYEILHHRWAILRKGFPTRTADRAEA